MKPLWTAQGRGESWGRPIGDNNRYQTDKYT